jgi:TRAP-type C4-dicarboxylate transport system permease small subunit
VNDARVAEDIDKAAPEPHGPLGRALERVCEIVAMAGGLLLVAIMLVSSVSVIGRGLSQVFGAKLSGIPGDIEIVQLGCAVAVFAFLPLCQFKRANVLVGAFTKNLPVRYRAMFDLAANLLFLVLAFALAWQLGHGTVEKFRNHDTTMVLRIPEGWPFAAALVFAWLLVIVTAYTAARSVMEIGTNRAIGPRPSGEH